MDKIILMKNADKKFLFETAAIKLKLNSAIIEKDFWICYILDYLFNKSIYKEFFTFKGGTSLSKAFNVISRMSEDIDIILDWRILDIPLNEPMRERSKTQQDLYNKKINSLAKDFIADKLYYSIKNDLSEIKDLIIEVIKEEQLINFYYPKVCNNDNVGILPCVRLEIGPLAAWSPASLKEINPYIKNIIPTLPINGTKVRTVTLERTFWEKITILHREANRPESKKIPKRYARHYYDVYKIFTSSYFDYVLSKKDILLEVTLFKIKFYNDSWANYNEILNNNIKILPENYRYNELKIDYNSMKEMFEGDAPHFNDMILVLKKLEDIINK
ncbi:MAG: nucleotidyl transferase AbiEii/AbiGii toxin family protein [Bacilli bacterium]|nr:nucleotidyl transferase AbiEii/AbiGii toxin family protein [Bacilli bacterium]